ncbi:MAG: hypothetical protein LUE98_04935 [Tannerellaceae bacterium]|nr:hypothetical protein [Tannerellaceae bacterium]
MDDVREGRSRIHNICIENIYTGQTNPSVFSIFEDASQNVWIGTNGGGVRFISKVEPFFHSWEAAAIPGVVNGMSDKEACTICVDDEGYIWIGADGGGINVYGNGIHSRVYSRESGDLTVNAFLLR